MMLKVYQRSSDDDCRDDTGWKKLQLCRKHQPPSPRLGDTTREAPVSVEKLIPSSHCCEVTAVHAVACWG
jgi:hypothetical protein